MTSHKPQAMRQGQADICTSRHCEEAKPTRQSSENGLRLLRPCGSRSDGKSESGNVLFMILIAVALFAALSYAVTNSSRSGSGNTDKEQQKLDQAVIDNYLTCINGAQMRLEISRNCSTINYDLPSTWSGPDFDCHMFHPSGGGCAYADLGLDSCAAQGGDLTTLAIGENCGGIVYAGESGGNRIYTTAADQGTASWNNGTMNWFTTGANSVSDGLANTNLLIASSDIGAPYQAAILCRALGADWYLPSFDELNLLYTNKDDIGGFGTGWYWASSEYTRDYAWILRFSDGSQTINTKYNTFAVRCARRD